MKKSIDTLQLGAMEPASRWVQGKSSLETPMNSPKSR
jgi:hypothetical protein